jgi:hypothetical protein
MKACQSWITSDEDADEDVESEMLPIFLHLLPILQSVTGAHWDLVFDVIENNLEVCFRECLLRSKQELTVHLSRAELVFQ